MSKDLKPKKKSNVNKPSQAQASRRANLKSSSSFPLLFSLQNYKWMIIGCALIGLGLLLMLGGNMKDPNVWDESVIYSFRRTLIAPLVILAGLGMQIYAIFKK